MLAKTEAIVLGSVKYGDSSLILKVYSKEAGLLSFIAGGVPSRKGPIKPAMAQVFTVLQVVYYHKGKGELKRLKEASVAEPLQAIYYHPIKSSLAMFLAEMLRHAIHEEEENPSLYKYLRNAVYALDELETGLGSFHLRFLIKLCDFLGFQSEVSTASDHQYFDLLNGVYPDEEPMHAHYIYGKELALWQKLQHEADNFAAPSQFTAQERKLLLDIILLYYRLHVKDFGTLKSVKILSELLS